MPHTWGVADEKENLMRHEVLVDTEIAEKCEVLWAARRGVESCAVGVLHAAGLRRGNVDRLVEVVGSLGEGHRAVVRWRESLAAVEVASAELKAAEARYGGWSRFFLVTNASGHIHSSMSCSTCYVSTEFRWLPGLSGLSEADAVEAHGEILCSVCFPSAPVAWTTGESRVKREAREKRDAEKAARAAKKAEKALLPSGEALVVNEDGRWPEELVTLASAKMWLTDAADWKFDHPSYRPEDVLRVAEAVAAKLGTSAEVEVEAARKRAAKRR